MRDADVQRQPVEAAELFGAALDGWRDRRDVGDVDVTGKGLAAFGNDLRNRIVGGFLVDIDAATSAPSRANSTDIARPLPTGGSSSMILRWPAPTTMIRRPVSRPWLLACPSASACSEAEGSTFFGAWVVVDIFGFLLRHGRASSRPSTSSLSHVSKDVDAPAQGRA